jgi:sugar fermentation stimulation protein A
MEKALMRFPSPLIPAILIRRYKRFLADVVLPSGEETIVHVANPGAMTGLAAPGSRVLLSKSANAARKLPLSWELVDVDLGCGRELVGINTANPNALVAEVLQQELIPELRDYGSVRREVRYGRNCRVDFLLEAPGRASCYLEIKNVHLMRQAGFAQFPDCVTARGAKHLDELAGMTAAGARAILLFVIQIGSAEKFSLARDIDPGYAVAFDRARARGVEALAWRCELSEHAIAIEAPVPILD